MSDRDDREGWGLQLPERRSTPREPSLLGSWRKRVRALREQFDGGSDVIAARTRRDVARELQRAEEEERELEFSRWVSTLPYRKAQAILREDIETQRLLLERERCRQQRLDPYGAPPPLPRPEPPASLPEPGRLEEDPGERETERLALKAVTHAAGLPPAQRPRFWAEWEKELHKRKPPYEARLVLARARELRQARFGGGG